MEGGVETGVQPPRASEGMEEGCCGDWRGGAKGMRQIGRNSLGQNLLTRA
jgi:hypothetical protein